jgi:general secretion pathway protein G
MKNQNQSQKGFTLIELMVVISVIALLASMALIALQSARQKSRDAKRLGDMAQMNTGLALYFASNKGYPSSVAGVPQGLAPDFASTLPTAPQPPDGLCATTPYPAPIPGGNYGNRYFYYASGTSYLAPDNVTTVFSDFSFYFCLGLQTSSFGPGIHVLTPEGVH